MNLIKCENEHYYDSDKFDSCPHCANIAADVKIPNLFGDNQNKIATVIPDQDVLKDYQKIGHRRVTGWLVCISGEMQGESFTLYGASIILVVHLTWMLPYLGNQLFLGKITVSSPTKLKTTVFLSL